MSINRVLIVRAALKEAGRPDLAELMRESPCGVINMDVLFTRNTNWRGLGERDLAEAELTLVHRACTLAMLAVNQPMASQIALFDYNYICKGCNMGADGAWNDDVTVFIRNCT